MYKRQLVPFAQNDDPTRSLMASNMQRQAVPLLEPETPIVGTGYERVVAESSGRLIKAEKNGVVVNSEAGKLTIKYDGDKKPVIHLIDKFIKTNQNTCFSQQVRAVKGEKFTKGDVLVDGPSTVSYTHLFHIVPLGTYTYHQVSVFFSCRSDN